MNALKTLLAGAALAVTASAGNAAVLYADKVISATYGGCSGTVAQCTADDRLNQDNALGATNGTFYALGLGGSMVVGFAKNLFPAGTVASMEITFNRLIGHDEAVRLETLDRNLNLVEDLGVATNNPAGASKFANLPFTYVRLVDVTKSIFPNTTSFDGYDVDSVSVAPVPLPAAGAMLLAGLGGLAMVRRRRNAA